MREHSRSVSWHFAASLRSGRTSKSTVEASVGTAGAACRASFMASAAADRSSAGPASASDRAQSFERRRRIRDQTVRDCYPRASHLPPRTGTRPEAPAQPAAQQQQREEEQLALVDGPARVAPAPAHLPSSRRCGPGQDPAPPAQSDRPRQALRPADGLPAPVWRAPNRPRKSGVRSSHPIRGTSKRPGSSRARTIGSAGTRQSPSAARIWKAASKLAARPSRCSQTGPRATSGSRRTWARSPNRPAPPPD